MGNGDRDWDSKGAVVHAFLHTLKAVVITTAAVEVEGTTGVRAKIVMVANFWILHQTSTHVNLFLTLVRNQLRVVFCK